MRFIIFICVLIGSNTSFSQDWELISEEFSAKPLVFFEDSVNNRLLIGGQFGFIGEQHFGGFASFDGENFQSLGCAYDCALPYSPMAMGGVSIASFQDTIYMNGMSFNWAAVTDTLFNNLPNSKGVVRMVNDEFETMDVSFTNNDLELNSMRVFTLNNSLYVTANHFQNVAGMSGYGGAKYDGNTWLPIQLPGCELNMGGVSGLVTFQNDIYICGDFSSCAEFPTSYIMRKTEEYWEYVGDPISSIYSGAVLETVVFQDELYVCGPFHRYEGNNAGECIMKWNGEEWSDLGSGLTENGLNTIDHMVILNDELYVCGRFTEVGGIPAHNLAKWDGNQWCAIQHNFTNNYIRHMGVFQNELYVFASTEEYSSRLWKWTGQSDTCSVAFNSVSELASNNELSVFPNPASEKLVIELSGNLSGAISTEVYNSLGVKVSKYNIISNQDNKLKINVSDIPKGFYTLVIKHEETVLTAKFIKE